jgi:hypothetical protein
VIAEAIAAAESVIRALLVWIVLAAVVLTAAGFAVVVAGWAVWRATVAAAKAVCAWLSWRLASELPPQDPPEGAPAPEVAHARTRPAPSWARTEEEAA